MGYKVEFFFFRLKGWLIYQLFHLLWIESCSNTGALTYNAFLVFLFRRLVEQSNLLGHWATFNVQSGRKRYISRVFSTILFSIRRYFRHVALNYVDQRFFIKITLSFPIVVLSHGDSRFRNRARFLEVA